MLTRGQLIGLEHGHPNGRESSNMSDKVLFSVRQNWPCLI